jgi:hypothetical protein
MHRNSVVLKLETCPLDWEALISNKILPGNILVNPYYNTFISSVALMRRLSGICLNSFLADIFDQFNDILNFIKIIMPKLIIL